MNDDVFERITLSSLRHLRKKGQKFACLTAYDATFARLVDEAGAEVVLVGDSLGMVVQGQETTIPVSMEEMIYHTRLVSRGRRHALLMADLPFLSYADPLQAIHNAGRLMQEGGADVIKLEGGIKQVEIVARLSDQGVPVCAHLGLRPQQVHKLGGYYVQGRALESAAALREDARALEQAGADLLLIESVPAVLAADIITQSVIPVIGIGAGLSCDGQVLVLHDVLGITPGHVPRFARNFMLGQSSIQGALKTYVTAVREESFPRDEESF